MENKEMLNLLKQLGKPVAYQSFKKKTELPYILLLQGVDNFAADNRVYLSSYDYRVELYDNDKNFELEKKLEKLFNDNEIYWEKSGDIRIESEQMTEVVYSI